MRRLVILFSGCLSLFLLITPLFADKSRILGEVTGVDSEGNVDYLRLPAPKILLSKKEIYHYEILRVTLEGADILDPDLFYMVVTRNGARCLSFGMKYKIPFLQKNGMLQAVYLPAWNEAEGELKIDFFYAGRKIQTDAPVKFVLKRRPVLPHDRILSIVDLEMNKSVAEKSFVGPNNRRKDYTAVLDWAQFMQADMLWILAGETTTFNTGRKIDSAWDEGPLENLYLLKEAVRGTPIKIGAYVMSFYVPGGTGVTERYEPGIGYNNEQDYLYRSRHISLGCEKRIEDITKLVRSFQNDTDIHYIGFDFIRTGRADGYELAEEVVDDTNICTPLEWGVYSTAEKIRWFARKIEVGKNPVIIEKWRWWRAHKVALIVRRIIEEAGVTKPVWVYTLGWDHGKEHGQDPVMFFDAGVSIDAVMLYEATRDQFVCLLGQWSKYFTQGQGNIVIGNCVDAALLDSDYLSPPDELFRRNREGYSSIMRNGFASGIFFHDIARALWGRKGGYTFRDYAVAFMSSVYSLKRNAREPELLIDVRLNDVANQSGNIQGELRIRNNSTSDIDSIHVELLPAETGASKSIIRYTLESAGDDTHTLLINDVRTFELLKIPFTLENIDRETTSIKFRVVAGEKLYYITKLLIYDEVEEVLAQNR